MAESYLTSFNSGQLGPLLNSRMDLDIYRAGCTTLRNFLVLPQGGVERRSGSKYLADATSSAARLIPFIFSRDTSYIVELTGTTIKVLDEEGTTLKSLTSPYDASDLPEIKYKQAGDILFMVCPNKAPQRLIRTSATPPDFTIGAVPFDYPIFMEENSDKDLFVTPKPLEWETATEYEIGDQIQESGNLYVCNTDHTSSALFATDAALWDNLYQESVDVETGNVVLLEATDDIFTSDMVGSKFRLRHQRTEDRIAAQGTLALGESSEAVLVDGSTYTINITNEIAYRGGWAECVVESNTGSGWSTLATYSYGTHTYTGSTGATNEIVRVRRTDIYPTPTCTYSIGLGSNRRVSGTFTGNDTSSPLEVSFSDWQVVTGGDWSGTAELEVSTDAKLTWTTLAIIGDSTDVNQTNFQLASPFREGANTWIRVKYKGSSGFKYNLNVTSVYAEGILSIDEFIDTTTVKCTVLNNLGGSGPTHLWSEGSFSDRRGFPTAIELHEERIIYAGTFTESSTVWMSNTGDYYNFQEGSADSHAIKILPNTNEPITWLLSKNVLYAGTRGSVVSISSVDGNIITPSTVKAVESIQFSGSTIQGVKTNETIVYLERQNKKLREIVYSDEEQGFISRDLTILVDDIGGVNGFTELALQRTPEQIVYGLRSDGLLGAFTYERSQDVKGWSVLNLGGIVKSIAVRPSSTFDELWVVIERTNGTYIEKIGTREFSDDLLDAWFVDSGVKHELPTTVYTITGSNCDDFTNKSITLTSPAHGLSLGDCIKLTTGYDSLNTLHYCVADVATNTFTLKQLDGSAYIVSSAVEMTEAPDVIYVGGAGYTPADGTYVKDALINGRYSYVKSGYVIYWTSSDFWALSDTEPSPKILYQNNTDSEYPPYVDWEAGFYGGPPEVLYELDITGSFIQQTNTWDGLDHLEGETVQVMGDGGFAGEYVVSGGEVTSDYFYSQAVIGLRYLSIWQPMFIAPASFVNLRYNNTALDAVLRFYRTIGGISGILVQHGDRDPELDFDGLDTLYPDLPLADFDYEPINFRTYSDALGEPIVPVTGTKLVNYNDTYSRVKSIFIIQGDPLPMTIQSAGINLQVGGK